MIDRRDEEEEEGGAKIYGMCPETELLKRLQSRVAGKDVCYAKGRSDRLVDPGCGCGLCRY